MTQSHRLYMLKVTEKEAALLHALVGITEGSALMDVFYQLDELLDEEHKMLAEKFYYDLIDLTRDEFIDEDESVKAWEGGWGEVKRFPL